jgi:hypothetical protein
MQANKRTVEIYRGLVVFLSNNHIDQYPFDESYSNNPNLVIPNLHHIFSTHLKAEWSEYKNIIDSDSLYDLDDIDDMNNVYAMLAQKLKTETFPNANNDDDNDNVISVDITNDDDDDDFDGQLNNTIPKQKNRISTHAPVSASKRIKLHPNSDSDEDLDEKQLSDYQNLYKKYLLIEKKYDEHHGTYSNINLNAQPQELQTLNQNEIIDRIKQIINKINLITWFKDIAETKMRLLNLITEEMEETTAHSYRVLDEYADKIFKLINDADKVQHNNKSATNFSNTSSWSFTPSPSQGASSENKYLLAKTDYYNMPNMQTSRIMTLFEYFKEIENIFVELQHLPPTINSALISTTDERINLMVSFVKTINLECIKPYIKTEWNTLKIYCQIIRELDKRLDDNAKYKALEQFQTLLYEETNYLTSLQQYKNKPRLY